MHPVRAMQLIRPVLGLIAALGLSACAPPPEPPPTSPEASRNPTAQPHRPQARLPDGAEITLELAITREEARQGLMYRPSLAEDRGMLFLFTPPGRRSMWMKNTWIPLDLIFLDRTGTVVHLVEEAPPCLNEPCPDYLSPVPISAVLEVAAGVAARHGVTVGAELEFRHVPDYPSEESGDEAAGEPAT